MFSQFPCVRSYSTCVRSCSVVFARVRLCSTCVRSCFDLCSLVFVCVRLCSLVFGCVRSCSVVFALVCYFSTDRFLKTFFLSFHNELINNQNSFILIFFCFYNSPSLINLCKRKVYINYKMLGENERLQTGKSQGYFPCS